jgi:hypothetical protein
MGLGQRGNTRRVSARGLQGGRQPPLCNAHDLFCAALSFPALGPRKKEIPWRETREFLFRAKYINKIGEGCHRVWAGSGPNNGRLLVFVSLGDDGFGLFYGFWIKWFSQSILDVLVFWDGCWIVQVFIRFQGILDVGFQVLDFKLFWFTQLDVGLLVFIRDVGGLFSSGY